MTERWYVSQMLAGYRSLAERNLDRQGFVHFSPTMVRRDGGVAPLFPGYLFVRFDVDACAWRSVNGTVGMVGLLPRWAERPFALATGVVEEMIMAGPLRVAEFAVLAERYSVGTGVEVVGGAFAGWAGSVVGYRGARVEVLMRMFDREVRAAVPEGMVRRSG